VLLLLLLFVLLLLQLLWVLVTGHSQAPPQMA
jgi:hypothetical protein